MMYGGGMSNNNNGVNNGRIDAREVTVVLFYPAPLTSLLTNIRYYSSRYLSHISRQSKKLVCP